MTDLIGFLRARLDEDEARAHRVQAALDAGWNYFDETPTELIDPARVLREVEAKRAILNAYEDSAIDSPTAIGDEPAWFEGVRYALEQLAAGYSDHPDYDPAWT